MWSVDCPALDSDWPQQLLSRHDELKERARQLLEATKREAREKDRLKKLNSKEKEDNHTELVNGFKNGDASPKKVGGIMLFSTTRLSDIIDTLKT